VVGVAAHLLLGFSLLEGLLLGSIISSTDAAAVFAVLRSKDVHLKGRLKPLLELESGSNDPMAVFLTVAFLQLLTQPSASAGELAVGFLLQMPLGAAVGYAAGRAGVFLINRIKLGYESTRSSPCRSRCSPTGWRTSSAGTGSSPSTSRASSSGTGRSSTAAPCSCSTAGWRG
jgi:cell volume regulation protein A